MQDQMWRRDGFQKKEEESVTEDGWRRRRRRHFFFFFSFFQLFCSNMNSQWNVYQSRSMGFRKFVLCFLSSTTLSPLTLLSMGKKMSNAIMRQRVRWWAAESDWTGQRKGREQKQQLVFQGVSWAPVLADRETKTGGGERKIWISSPRGREA